MSQNSGYSENVKKILGQKLDAAKLNVVNIRKEALKAEIVEKNWGDLNKFTNLMWNFHILDLLSREKAYFSQLKIEDNTIEPTLTELEKSARINADLLIKRFPNLMEKEFKESKMLLDKDSPHPKYTFEKMFFTVAIDEYKGVATISDSEGILKNLPADIEAIHQALEEEYIRIFERPFDGEKFFHLLQRNYSWIIKHENLKYGDSIPIRWITKRLGKIVKGFKTDEFVFDLSRLISQGVSELDGIKIDFQQTKDTHKGILVQTPMQRSYIGFITFKEV